MRTVVPLALLAAVVASSGCGRADVREAPEPAEERPSPVGTAGPPAFERPDLETLSDKVRAELQRRHDGLEQILARSDVDAAGRARAYGEVAMRYHAYGVADAAIAGYANAEALAPEDFRWPYYLGLALLQVERLDPAAEAFERASALAPRYVPARVRVGEIRLEQNRLDAALEAFRIAIDLDDASAAARYGLGRVLAARGDDASAASALESALELQPGATRMHYALAQAYRNLGRMDDARHHLDRYGEGEVIVGDALLAELGRLTSGEMAHLVSGRAALRMGLLERGLDEYYKAVEVSPDSADARSSLAQALARLGRIDAAIEHAVVAVELAPRRPGLRVSLGNLYAGAGRVDDALASLGVALDLDPGNTSARVRLAAGLAGEGRTEEALTHYRGILDVDPDHRPALRGVSDLLVRAGRDAEAIPVLERWVAAAPERALPRVNLAAVLVKAGRNEEARTLLEEAVRLPGNPALLALAHFNLGALQAASGSRESALEQYRAALELDPTLHRARFNLALGLVREGDHDEAQQALARILSDDPDSLATRLALADSLTWVERYAGARAVLQEGLERAPGPELANALARLLATCPDDAVRDGAAAVRWASAALDHRPSPEYLETLAMALAEAGDFARAVETQSAVIREAEKLGDPALVARLKDHLESYRAGRSLRAPWRSG